MDKAAPSSATKYPPLPNLPQHIGFIMDGNGRWAKRQGLPRLAGHRAGVENLRRVLRTATDFNIPFVTMYAFSTENWQRPESEVRGLLKLLGEGLDKEVGALHKNGVKLKHIGNLDPLSASLRRKVLNAVALTRNNTRLTANIAFNYGGRQEITRAVRHIIRDQLSPAEITDEVFSSYLYTAGQPDPDLIVRTSGEHRVSNFMIWQSAYAEYYITSTYWPDFDKEEFYQALLSFNHRERRFGGLVNIDDEA